MLSHICHDPSIVHLKGKVTNRNETETQNGQKSNVCVEYVCMY